MVKIVIVIIIIKRLYRYVVLINTTIFIQVHTEFRYYKKSRVLSMSFDFVVFKSVMTNTF
jgi:hypothetical protein